MFQTCNDIIFCLRLTPSFRARNCYEEGNEKKKTQRNTSVRSTLNFQTRFLEIMDRANRHGANTIALNDRNTYIVIDRFGFWFSFDKKQPSNACWSNVLNGNVWIFKSPFATLLRVTLLTKRFHLRESGATIEKKQKMRFESKSRLYCYYGRWLL